MKLAKTLLFLGLASVVKAKSAVDAKSEEDKLAQKQEDESYWSRLLDSDIKNTPSIPSFIPSLPPKPNPVVDCDALTDCQWNGFDPDKLGDGICNDEEGQCYNTAVCGFDNGDCLIFQRSAFQEDILALLPSTLAQGSGDYHGLTVFWNGDGSKRRVINCNRLTRCDWPGIQTSWLNDSVCDDNVGCYGEKICNYDEGDCNIDQLEMPPDDCDALTTCDWVGFDPKKLGDGYCDKNSCYNSRVCGFDGGDCCYTSCFKKQEDDPNYPPEGSFCGMNGYDCKTTELCFAKNVKIKKFEVTGTVSNERLLDPTNLVETLTGDIFEIQLSVDGEVYWPKFGEDDCPFGQQVIDFDATDFEVPGIGSITDIRDLLNTTLDDAKDFVKSFYQANTDQVEFCRIRGGSTLKLANASVLEPAPQYYQSISLGVREADPDFLISRDDSWTVTLSPEDWFKDTCFPYEITASVRYSDKKTRTVDAKGALGLTVKGSVDGGVGGDNTGGGGDEEGEEGRSSLGIGAVVTWLSTTVFGFGKTLFEGFTSTAQNIDFPDFPNLNANINSGGEIEGTGSGDLNVNDEFDVEEKLFIWHIEVEPKNPYGDHNKE